MIRVQAADFDPGEELAQLTRGRSNVGAVASFIGLVRDTSAGRPLTAMVLEHYPGMTERRLAALEADARRRWPLAAVLIIHRFGRLLPGERIVLAAAASGHRTDAFDACRFLVDVLKTDAPFWKKEETAAGIAWVAASAVDAAQAARWRQEPASDEARTGATMPGATMPGATMSGADAVLFDFDGVIVESEHIKTEAFRRLYAPYGPVVVAAALAHHLAHGGISRRKKIRYCHRMLLGIELAADELDVLCHRFSRLVEDQVVAAAPVAGAEALLRALDGRTPMFIVSGTPQEELGRIVDRRGLTRHFAGVYGSPTEKPELIRDILARYRLAAAACVFIGDAMTDYVAARACDVPFVGRVAAGNPDPFPPGTTVIRDLTGFVP